MPSKSRSFVSIHTNDDKRPKKRLEYEYYIIIK